MKKINRAFLFLTVLTVFFTGCNKQKLPSNKKTELIILAAASLTDVCSELKTEYEAEHKNIDLLFSFGGSGALQAQIEEGVKADVFFSADVKQMNALKSKGLVYEDTIVNLLENKLVLVVPKNQNNKNIASFEDTATDKVSMIGIGEPKSVPAGRYAMEVFDFLGISDSVKAKANYGMDVRTVLTWVEEGAVDCGIVYQTDAFSSKKVSIVATAPEGSLRKVVYSAAVVKNGEFSAEAKDFLQFLRSEKAMQIFKTYGFAQAN